MTTFKDRLALLIDVDSSSAVRGFNESATGAKTLQQETDKSAGRFANLGTAARNAGPVIAGGLAVGGAAAFAVGKDLFLLGADLEQMAAKAKTVFGDQIPVVEKWAAANAVGMGLTRREATGLATNLADLLIPMGFTREQATGMSTDVVGLSGALAAWSGGTKTAAEVSEILTGAMLGEYDSLKSLGIGLSAAEVQARLTEKGQKDLTGAALAQAEALAVQELILEKTTDAQAAFADGTQTANERLAEQKARLREVREELADKLTPATVAFVDSFLGGLGRLADHDAEWPWIRALKDDLLELKGAVRDVVHALGDAGKSTGSFLGDIGRGIAEGVGSGGSGLLGRRAAGGPVARGGPTVVGEQGPELFVPTASGRIIPNQRLGAGGSTVVNINMPPGSDGDDVVRAIRRWEKHNGPFR